MIWIPQDPGAGGKEAADILLLELAGFVIHAELVTGSKLARAGPLSAQVEAGNVRLLRGQWNEIYLEELHRFDGSGRGHDDQVDASSGAFNKLALEPGPMSIGVLGQSAGPRRVVMTR